MGLKQRLTALFTQEDAAPDPDAQVQVALVALHAGPMVIEQLRAEGIDANGLESFDVVTGSRTQMRIMVSRRDLDAAQEVLARG